MARMATGNYHAVIVSHRLFEFLPVSDKYFNSSKGDNRRMVKELEKAKKRLEIRLKRRACTRT